MAKTKKKNKVLCKSNIPNVLVIVRMVLAVVVGALLIANHYTKGFGDVNILLYTLAAPKWFPGRYVSSVYLFYLIAACLFVVACITDWLDGFLARKYKWVSDFGKFWDPIADKVLVNTTLICFAWSGYCTVLIPIIMIARDVITDAAKMNAAKHNIVVPANFWGKCKTVLQMVGIILIFFVFAYNGTDLGDIFYWTIQQLMLYLATIMSVASGIIYLVQIKKAMKETKHAK